MTEPTIAALLDVAHDLIAQRRFDAGAVLMLLSKLPSDKFDVQTCGAIKHAQLTAAGAGGSSRTAVARFALARVVMLLEAAVEAECRD